MRNINFFFFFFSSRRRHTRFKCDWSSDVCSSDLEGNRTTYASWPRMRTTNANPPDMRGQSSRGVPAKRYFSSSDRDVEYLLPSIRARVVDAADTLSFLPHFHQKILLSRNFLSS